MARIVTPITTSDCTHLFQKDSRPKMTMKAIGSAYTIRDVPGSERCDGATVTIRPASQADGEVTIDVRDCWSGDLIDDAPAFLATEARDAVARFSEDRGISPDALEFHVSRFAYHPVNTSPNRTRVAVYNALTAAYAQWDS